MRNAVHCVLLGTAALLAACATAPVTRLEVSWVTPQLPPAPFRKLLIITVASDEFAQIAFQDQMAAALQERGVNAVASHRYFTRYTASEKARFKQSIDESDADAVLLARVTATDSGVHENTDVVLGAGGVPYTTNPIGVGDVYGRYVYGNAYVPGSDAIVKNVTAEASIFVRKGEQLIWSARTRTTNAQNVKSSAAAAEQYIAVILDAMKKDKLI
jgi:hypothetical protein